MLPLVESTADDGDGLGWETQTNCGRDLSFISYPFLIGQINISSSSTTLPPQDAEEESSPERTRERCNRLYPTSTSGSGRVSLEYADVPPMSEKF